MRQRLIRRSVISRIALTWELGTGHGHLAELLPLARALRARGHEITLNVRELHAINPEQLTAFRFLQAPVMLAGVNGLPEPPLNYAEILLRFGYLNAGILDGLVAAWRNLFKLVDAEVVVSSHSPTAMLAARTLALPVLTVGSGFCVPPRVNPAPNMRPWMPVPAQRLAEADRIVTESINAVLQQYGKPPLEFVAELFDVRANLLCTFPEFDHYQPRIAELQRGLYPGPILETSRGIPLAWPDGTGKKVLVYLRPETRDCEAIMQALVDAGCRVLAAIPGVSPSYKMQMESTQCRIFDRGIHLASVLPDCDLAINYGGHGYISAVLAAGVPMLCVPMHLEQFLLSRHVANLGAGMIVNPEAPPPDYRQLIPSILTNTDIREGARKFAEKYRQFDQSAQIESIARLVESAIHAD